MTFLKDETKVQCQFKVGDNKGIICFVNFVRNVVRCLFLTKPVVKPRILIVTKTREEKECREETDISHLRCMKAAASRYQAVVVSGICSSGRPKSLRNFKITG